MHPLQKRIGLFFVVAAIVLVAFLFLTRGKGTNVERLMGLGRGYLERGEATNAIRVYSQALRLDPGNLDATLNLAVANLMLNHNREVIANAEQALTLDHDSAAAHYLIGCAYLRLNDPQKALAAFQQSRAIDPAVTALDFQLGLAHTRLEQFEDAARQFETVLQFEPEHPSAHYQLSQVYQRLGRTNEAAAQMAEHQRILAKGSPPSGPLAFERCKYTEPRIKFVLEQPDKDGNPVKFGDSTAAAFGADSALYRGPIAVIDYAHEGRNSLVALGTNGLTLLSNSNGQFSVLGRAWPLTNGTDYRRCLVGDLNNDRADDVLLLGEKASHLFRFRTNGEFREVSVAAGLKGLRALDGVFADLDFTGFLDFLTIQPGDKSLRLYRNLGNMYFQENTTQSGLSTNLPGLEQVVVEDWNAEDVPGLIIARGSEPTTFYSRQRAGQFVETNSNWGPNSAVAIAAGDLNNDLRVDLVTANAGELSILLAGAKESLKVRAPGQVTRVQLLDFDNDGWLDILAFGSTIGLWRNQGQRGFKDVTDAAGLAQTGTVASLVAADFDNDGDTDLALSTPAGLKMLRNDGGNRNSQLKLQLVGNRSNASGIGVRVELRTGRWQTIRTLNELPFEIGLGKYDKIETLKSRWFDLSTTLVDISVTNHPLEVVELVLPSGSCPYLYAWDGQQFRFVTDILGAAPMGLPISETRYVEADPEEYLFLGGLSAFPPQSNRFELRITEELREVLYLDYARLVAVDHPEHTGVFTTSKMLPGKPFHPHELWTLREVAQVQQATRSDGQNVSKSLRSQDRQMVGPVQIRAPQLRGLAEPFSITLDFGQVDTTRPLVLVLNGWIRFGGGMANMAGSLDASLPFPFPSLEAEAPDGSWQSVNTPVGVPAGKTKTILVDLENKLPEGTRRLRLSMAFELYWDFACLAEKVSGQQSTVTRLAPSHTDLRWRGFSKFIDLPPSLPLTPDYAKPQPNPPWRRTPSGWCTRYGAVDELVAAADNRLALLNGGDELAFSFPAGELPPLKPGFQRSFFLHVVGWDKDADYHVGQGWRVEPLPFTGMNDQAYGSDQKPANFDESWVRNYNTRWVGPLVLTRAGRL